MSDSLFKYSSVMFLSIGISNIFAYFYHILMARYLGPISYGEFGSLLAFFMILAIPMGTIQTVMTKFVSKFKINGDKSKIGEIIFISTKKLFFYGLLLFVFVSFLSPAISSFLRINSTLPFIIIGSALLFSMLLPINRGALQGLQKFNSLALNNIIEAVARLVFGIILVIWGWGLEGALISFSLGYLVAFLVAFIPLKKYLISSNNELEIKEIYQFAWPTLFVVFFLNILINFPIILIKHFYSPLIVGYFNVALTLSRSIQYITMGISLVMFSKVSENASRGKNTFKILIKSVFYVLLIGLIIFLILLIGGEKIIFYLFSSEYIESKNMLGLTFLIFIIYSLSSVLINYRLALNKNTLFKEVGLISLLGIGLIYIYPNSIEFTLKILLIVISILFISESFILIKQKN